MPTREVTCALICFYFDSRASSANTTCVSLEACLYLEYKTNPCLCVDHINIFIYYHYFYFNNNEFPEKYAVRRHTYKIKFTALLCQMQSIIMLRVRYVRHFSSHAFYLYFRAYLLVMLNFVLLFQCHASYLFTHTHVSLKQTWSQNEQRRQNHQINCTLWFVSQIMFCFSSILHLFCYFMYSIRDGILLLVKRYHLFQSFQLKIKRFWFKSPVHLPCLIKFIKWSLYIEHKLTKSQHMYTVHI